MVARSSLHLFDILYFFFFFLLVSGLCAAMVRSKCRNTVMGAQERARWGFIVLYYFALSFPFMAYEIQL